ncbi:hypothetical protein [Micromonospora sp. KC213]|uniref:hypothetical protein n=1 Tax=Micromonospora sp. KC213 TaxID=2530378 RepID=UPI00104B9CA8|nr:hypothetical protein [Micromonospora sp. KC213]TDC42035.1 hypothetical protein E1166_09340 [Micromonospora sp. KC213]
MAPGRSTTTDRPLTSWAGLTWRSREVLIGPQPDAAHPVVSVKDPTVVRWRDRWGVVHGTTADTRSLAPCRRLT